MKTENNSKNSNDNTNNNLNIVDPKKRKKVL